MIIFRFFCEESDEFHALVSKKAEEGVIDVNFFFHLIYILNFILREKNLLMFLQEP